MMSEREVEVKSLLDSHLEKRITVQEVAQRLGLSTRQVLRKKRAYKKGGVKALVSKKRGKQSNRAFLDRVKSQVLEIVSSDLFKGFGPTFASEILEKQHSLKVNRETLRLWMIEEGLWKAKQKHTGRVYQQRLRRGRFGSLVQLDGSDHAWFEDRGAKCTLLMAVDDATGKITSARFEKSETTAGYFRLLKSHIEEFGRPMQLYPDKYSVFKVNAKGAKHHITQFTRGMKELGIEVVCANSPQAKGRIERSFGTHQDRLIKLMRLKGISSIEEANRFLEKYIVEHNGRFSIEAKDPSDAHLPLNPNHDLRRSLATHSTRKISKNLEINWKNEVIQIQAPERKNRLAKKSCLVIETLEGELLIEYQGEFLPWNKLGDRPLEEAPVIDSKELQASEEPASSKGKYKPDRNHPWRQSARGSWLFKQAKRRRKKDS